MTVDVMVKDTPLLMRGPLVCATLEDLKTQTRRTNGLDEINSAPDSWEYIGYTGNARHMFRLKDSNPLTIKCPYGKPGDRLWVRETFHVDPHNDCIAHYRADGACKHHERGTHRSESWREGWKPSIHMPRWASRINLEIVSIRVERLNDMPAMDAVAEGVPRSQDHFITQRVLNELNAFRRLWDSINAKRGYGWAENPWVWVVEFKRLEVPGDG